MKKITKNEYELTTIDISNNCYYSIKLKNDENIENLTEPVDKEEMIDNNFIYKK